MKVNFYKTMRYVFYIDFTTRIGHKVPWYLVSLSMQLAAVLKPMATGYTRNYPWYISGVAMTTDDHASYIS